MDNTTLLDAIKVAKGNEKLASESYKNASQKINNKMGKMLFEQLSEFEDYHYNQLTALENSIVEKGDFMEYAGKNFPLPPILEVNAAKEPERKSVMSIITDAIDLEKRAEKAYSDLAHEVSNPQGHAMFSRLAEEEHNHYLILWEAYWTLTNLGVWKWTPA